MTKNLADSVRAYTDRNEGQKTKQKTCSTLFRTKNTAFYKKLPDYGVASLKMIKKWI
jgi:hypothetical protein